MVKRCRYDMDFGELCYLDFRLGINEWQVLTGYFGPLPGGLLEQLGRGYSDLCAALAAVGTEAKELQVIYTLRFSHTHRKRRYKFADLRSGLERSFRGLHCVNVPELNRRLISPRLTEDSDPSKVPTATVLRSIDPREANELTYVLSCPNVKSC